MPWSGGSYTKGNNATGGWTGDASLGIGIEAGRHDTQDNDFATGINQCLNKDGSNPATGPLNAGGFKVTNVAAGTARTDASQVAQIQDGDFVWLGTTAGTATAQTASAAPALTAYKAGQKFRAIIGSFNSTGSAATAHTLNVNGLGAKNVTNQDNTDITSGSFVAGAIIEVVYDGTRFKITNDPGGWQNWTPTLNAPVGSIASTTILMARYRKIGQVVTLQVHFTTTATGVGAQIEITNPPVNLANTGTAYTIQYAHMVVAGTPSVGYLYNNSGTNIAVAKDIAFTNIGTGSVQSRWTFIYESV